MLKPARAVLARLVIQLRQVEAAAEEGDPVGALARFAAFRQGLAEARPLLAAAEPVSLYGPDRLACHQALLAMVANH